MPEIKRNLQKGKHSGSRELQASVLPFAQKAHSPESLWPLHSPAKGKRRRALGQRF
jgi:hypothetical protein